MIIKWSKKCAHKKVPCGLFYENYKMNEQVENYLKNKNMHIPNIKAKLWEDFLKIDTIKT